MPLLPHCPEERQRFNITFHEKALSSQGLPFKITKLQQKENLRSRLPVPVTLTVKELMKMGCIERTPSFASSLRAMMAGILSRIGRGSGTDGIDDWFLRASELRAILSAHMECQTSRLQ